MELWTAFEQLRARHDVLRHPFYRRWSKGELALADLACYAGQYRHAVVALAQAATQAAAIAGEDGCGELRARLSRHAREEREHVALWDRFAEAVGGSLEAIPTAETLACGRTWAPDAERPLLPSLMALHAIEAPQPAIAATKRAGLIEHYGLAEGPATSYFKLHEQLDLEHARGSRELIDEASPTPAEVRSLLDEAEAVLGANWLLLDGVERICDPTL